MSLRSFLLASFMSLLSTTCLGENRIANIHEGTNIAVTLPPNGDTLVIDLIGQLWQFPLSGGAANPLTPSTTIARNPRFSPDGAFLVYQSEGTSQWDLWLLDIEKGIQHQLTNTPHNEVEPDFSANGSSVIFSSNLTGNYDIWEINIESGNLTQLTSSAGKASFPSVSERGEIAYVNEQNGRWSLELLQGEISTELFSKRYPLRAPSWRPGGGVIIFNERPNPGQSNLMMILLDTEPLTKTLTSGEDVFGFRPAWLSPGEFVYTADGGVWRRRLASTTRQAIQFFAGVTVTRPSYPRRTVDFDRLGSGAVAAEPYVIQVDRLFDGISNQYRRHMDVHVDGQRITDVIARGLKPLPSRVIDARGYTLIPGLIDLHTHETNFPDERLGRAWLSYGVTTIREVETNPNQWEAGRNRKPAWSANPRAGPRLILTAPVINQSDTPVRDLGSEFAVFQISRGQPEQFSSRSINNVRELGVPIFGQTLFPAARFGIDGLEHIGSMAGHPYSLERSGLNRSYQDIFSVLIETRTVVIPALVAFGGFQALVGNDPTWARDNAYVRLFSPTERAQWEGPVDSREQLGNLQRIVAQLIQAGGRVAAGSDSPTSPYGLGLHAELALLSEAGVPNDQVLRLVTSGAALALGVERDLGTIEPGKLADFVLLSGNPLTRIQDSLRIEAVVKDGLWTARDELLAEP